MSSQDSDMTLKRLKVSELGNISGIAFHSCTSHLHLGLERRVSFPDIVSIDDNLFSCIVHSGISDTARHETAVVLQLIKRSPQGVQAHIGGWRTWECLLRPLGRDLVVASFLGKLR